MNICVFHFSFWGLFNSHSNQIEDDNIKDKALIMVTSLVTATGHICQLIVESLGKALQV